MSFCLYHKLLSLRRAYCQPPWKIDTFHWWDCTADRSCSEREKKKLDHFIRQDRLTHMWTILSDRHTCGPFYQTGQTDTHVDHFIRQDRLTHMWTILSDRTDRHTFVPFYQTGQTDKHVDHFIRQDRQTHMWNILSDRTDRHTCGPFYQTGQTDTHVIYPSTYTIKYIVIQLYLYRKDPSLCPLHACTLH